MLSPTEKISPRAGMKRDFLVIPHRYSCGGFWIAERMTATGNNIFMNSSGFAVLSQSQVETRLDYCRARGEIVAVAWVNRLPDDAKMI